MRKIIALFVVLAFLLPLTSCRCSGPYPEPKNAQPSETVQQSNEAPVPTPAPALPTVTKTKPKVIIYVNMEEGSFSLNKTGMKMLESGRYVIHVQHGYTYDIRAIQNGEQVSQNCKWSPNGGKVTIGLYDTVTGKYAVSVRVR